MASQYNYNEGKLVLRQGKYANISNNPHRKKYRPKFQRSNQQHTQNHRQITLNESGEYFIPNLDNKKERSKSIKNQLHYQKTLSYQFAGTPAEGLKKLNHENIISTQEEVNILRILVRSDDQAKKVYFYDVLRLVFYSDYRPFVFYSTWKRRG